MCHEIGLKDKEFFVLLDSSSDEHLTQREIAEETGKPTYTDGPPLGDVQGNGIEDEEKTKGRGLRQA